MLAAASRWATAVHSPATAALALPSLGIGLTWQGGLAPFIAREGHRLDYLEAVPDMLWLDRGPRRRPRYRDHDEALAAFTPLAQQLPVIAHSIGLSIGSAHRFDRAHIEQMRAWRARHRCPWHSDHLSFHLAHGLDGEMNAGFTMPLAWDEDTLALLVRRVATVRRRIPVPFLLETNVYYLRVLENDYDEPTFLNELCARSGCGLVLDLHNVYCNALNHRFDPFAFLAKLDLRHVGEIHLAGGMELDGFYLDAHRGTTPAPVWRMLEWVLPRAPNLGGITFELFKDWIDELPERRLIAELERMRDAWKRLGPGAP